MFSLKIRTVTEAAIRVLTDSRTKDLWWMIRLCWNSQCQIRIGTSGIFLDPVVCNSFRQSSKSVITRRGPALGQEFKKVPLSRPKMIIRQVRKPIIAHRPCLRRDLVEDLENKNKGLKTKYPQKPKMLPNTGLLENFRCHRCFQEIRIR